MFYKNDSMRKYLYINLFTIHPMTHLAIIFSSLSLLAGCSESITYQNIEKQLQTELILAQDGDTLRIPEGHFQFTGTLSMDDRNDIVLKGAGRDKTFLSFKGQQEGSEGIKITNGSNITLLDFTIQDSKGDGIKTQNIKNIIFRNLRTEWTGKPKETNGAYGIYPVDCDNVLIEACISIGASDAGIYVGQSRDVIVRHCEAFHNVAGIEIENCIRAEVYQNYAHHNTGGILIFDMPELTQSGHTVRVYDNTIWRNNYRNFAPAGNIVHEVPPGTGVMILATRNVEVFNNRIINNKTIGTAITSYLLVQKPHDDENFNPYPKSIYVHGNEYKRRFWLIPALSYDMGKLLFMKFWFSIPDIIHDGYLDPAFTGDDGKYKQAYRICARNNGNAKLVMADAPNGFKNIQVNPPEYDCEISIFEPLEM